MKYVIGLIFISLLFSLALSDTHPPFDPSLSVLDSDANATPTPYTGSVGQTADDTVEDSHTDESGYLEEEDDDNDNGDDDDDDDDTDSDDEDDYGL